jgi:hypothetical protein
MTRRLLVRASVCGAVLCAALAGAALAQDDDGDAPAASPIVVNINGPCVLTVDDKPQACRGVAYMAFPSNHRIDFTALTETAGWAFSGDEDQNDDGAYTLALDSVLTPSAGRLDADGECDMQVGEDGRTVMSLRCEASTDDGDLVLQASGAISVDDRDDGDDQDDDGPDRGQG